MEDGLARRVALGGLLSAGIGVLAHRRHLLTASGALGAVATGTTIVAGGGWAWGVALVYFFVSSSAASSIAPRRKARVAADKFAKGSQRDLAQALANGGAASAAALLHATPWGRRHEPFLLGAFAGALATATADTWATEIGTLSRQPPRLVTSWRRVAPGTSGGVTALGLAASAAGALTLGSVLAAGQALLRGREGGGAVSWRELGATVGAAAIGGLMGSLADSALGATLQAMYRCPRCGVETERREHACGARTELVRGLPWVDNDGVNAASTTLGGVAAGLLQAGWLRD